MSGIIVWLTLAATLAGPPAEAAAPVSQPAVQVEVRRLIEQLGDMDFHVRTAAFKRLKAIGRPAYDQLKAAGENSSDAEVVSNCEKLLAAIGPMVAGERFIRERPGLAGALGELAKTHPHVVTLLGGSVEQQVAALVKMRKVRGTAAVLDILHEWATAAKDASVRDQAGYTYVVQGIQMVRMAPIDKDARRRQRMIEFVFAGKGGWRRLPPPVRATAIGIISRLKETSPFFRAAAEKCIRAHPAVAKSLGAVAGDRLDIVAGLGGSVDQQVVALVRLRYIEPAGEILDILHHWATRAENPTVRGRAGLVYVSHGTSIKTMALLEKDTARRRQLIEFVFTGTSDWTDRRRYTVWQAERELMRFEESRSLLARCLVRFRKDAEADLGGLCTWLALIGGQPASRHRQLVPAVVVFLDDTRTIKQRPGHSGRALSWQVADNAILTLHHMTGKKWAAGLPKVLAYRGAFIFETDAVRQRYIAAFRAWYGKHRDQFAPDPTTRPAVQQ